MRERERDREREGKSERERERERERAHVLNLWLSGQTIAINSNNITYKTFNSVGF